MTLKFKDNAKPDYKKVEYSLDEGTTWTALSSKSQAITLAKKGDKVMFRGDNPTYNGDAQFIIEQASKTRGETRAASASVLVLLYNNLMSMVQKNNFEGITKLVEANINTFKELLKDAPINAQNSDGTKKLVIPVEQLAEGSLESFLEGSATSVAPSLDLTLLVTNCLKNMCKDCPNLANLVISFEGFAQGATAESCMGGALEGAGANAKDPTAVIDGPDDAATEAAALAMLGSTSGGEETWNLIDGEGEDILNNKDDDDGDDGNKDVTGVKLNKTELTLEIDASETLTATVSPSDASDPTVTWTTSDAKVATVENGKVTGVAVGKATITATAGKESATCEVTITGPVTSVTLDQKELTLEIGDAVTLTATVKPDEATDPTVTWTTSDSKIATIKDGKVTAVAVGTATITATAGEKSDTCKITVIDPNSATIDVTYGEKDL